MSFLPQKPMTFRIVRIANDLQQTFSVAQINKNNSAMVAATVSPTIQGHCLTNEFLVNETGIFGTHKCSQYMKGRISQIINRSILI